MPYVLTKNNFTGTIDAPNITQNRNFNLPNASGNLVVDSQLSAVALSGSYNDLTNKPSFPVTPNAYVTQTWCSGTSWYRKWSNGFIEQGGLVTCKKSAPFNTSFHTAFTNTNYTIIATVGLTGSDTSQGGIAQVRAVSTSQFIVRIRATDLNWAEPAYWYACGY